MPVWSGRKSLFSLAGAYVGVLRAKWFDYVPRQVPLLHLTVLDRCNSRCRSCDIWKCRPNSPPELTTEEILALLPAAQKLRVRIVTLGGGEPTMRSDLETIIRAYRGAGMTVHMLTNGLTVTAGRAQSLVDAGLCMVRMSCDHVTAAGYHAIRGVDGLDKVVATVRAFRAASPRIPIGINVVISRMNQDVIAQFPQRAVEWGVDKMQFIPVHAHLQHRTMDKETFEPLMPAPADMPRIVRDLHAAAAALRRAGIRTNSRHFIRHFQRAYDPRRLVPCTAGAFSVNVTAFGEVVPCYQHPSGLNVRNTPLDEIVRSEEYRRIRRQVACCRVPCWDVGTAEPDLLFHVPYLLRHPVDAARQILFYAPR